MNTPPPLPTVASLYAAECARLQYTADGAQLRTVRLLDDLRERLIAQASAKSLLRGLFTRGAARRTEQGLYLWGGVGRGKTWLMDLFFQSLPFKDKQRSHFYRFMQFVHAELKRHADESDPLEHVADKVAKRTRVLCFDELFVTDIADAMLLGTLFRGLFERGVTLVATSNVPPDDLYKDGLQRARFLPAIELIKQHTHVVHMDAGIDYRLRMLERASTWFRCDDAQQLLALEQLFMDVAGEPGTTGASLTIHHRKLHPLRLAEDVVWFSFQELCEGPRSQADYIELAHCYHSVFLSDVPILTAAHDNQARRFITLVDEFYDRAVKLVVCAAAPIEQIYQGHKLKFEFERTTSRLIEMQSQHYLAREHRA